MAFVVSIQGCHGVGKSTLLRGMADLRPNLHLCDEGVKDLDARKCASSLRMDVETEFYEIQRWYINYEVQRFASFGDDDVVVLDRGPEEKEFYLFFYPRYIGKNWDVESRLAGPLERLRQCRSNRILYLTAAEESIERRVAGDTQQRPFFREWLLKWQDLVDMHFRSNPKTVVLDTTEMSAKDVAVWTTRWLDAGCTLFP